MRTAATMEMHAQALMFDMAAMLVGSTSAIARLWRRWPVWHGVHPDAVRLASPGRRTIDMVGMFAP